MVSVQDDPIYFSEGRNCNRRVLYSEPFTYAQGACSQPYKGNLHQTIVIFRLLGVLLTIIAWFPFKTTQPGSVRAEIATQSILL